MKLGKIKAGKIGKPKISNISRPRPVVMKAIGDFFVYMGGAVTSYAILNEDKWFALGSVVCTGIGHFFTSLYAANPDEIKQSIITPDVEQDEALEDSKKDNTNNQ